MEASFQRPEPFPATPPPARVRRRNRGFLIVSTAAAIAALGGFAFGTRLPSGASNPPEVAAAQLAAQEATLLDRALALHGDGDLAEAERAYKAVLSKNATNKFALFNLGQIAAQSPDRRDDAIERYRQALAIDPNFAPARFNLGLAYAAAGRVDEAIEQMSAAVELQPNDAASRFQLGKLLIVAGRSDDGAALLAEAFALDPKLRPQT